MTRRLTTLFALLTFVVSLGISTIASASNSRNSVSSSTPVHVKGYKKKDGTHVKAHDRKAPKEHATKPPKTPKTTTAKKTSGSASSSSAERDEKGRIQRSDAARHAFARQTGYPNGRPGYVIDHIIPLACGGSDTPGNMQWQTVEVAKLKDKTERAGCR